LSRRASGYRDDGLNKTEATLVLRKLGDALGAGEMDTEAAYWELEKLTFALPNVPGEAERRLNSFVNDVERIRFTLLADDQVAAVRHVLVQAEEFIAGLP
jgi:hypothetical protein